MNEAYDCEYAFVPTGRRVLANRAHSKRDFTR